MEEMMDALMEETATTGEVAPGAVLQGGVDVRTLALSLIHPHQAGRREEDRTHVPDPDLVLIPKKGGIGHHRGLVPIPRKERLDHVPDPMRELESPVLVPLPRSDRKWDLPLENLILGPPPQVTG